MTKIPIVLITNCTKSVSAIDDIPPSVEYDDDHGASEQNRGHLSEVEAATAKIVAYAMVDVTASISVQDPITTPESTLAPGPYRSSSIWPTVYTLQTIDPSREGRRESTSTADADRERPATSPTSRTDSRGPTPPIVDAPPSTIAAIVPAYSAGPRRRPATRKSDWLWARRLPQKPNAIIAAR